VKEIMSETPVSLLERLRLTPNADSWQRLVDLYTPWIRSWLSRQGLAREDVEDLTQEVLGVLVQELPRFEHNNRRGAFRHWLRLVTVHRWRAFWRARHGQPGAAGGSAFERLLERLEDNDSNLSRLWEREHDVHVARRLTEMIQPDFEPSTWQAFRRLVLEGAAAKAVAAELNLSVNAVLLAKSRVLRRLRQQGRGLLD
jgi:RNA polymerase sigma-70 factor, ECF subfamily